MAKMILAELYASLFPDDPPLAGWQTLSNSDAEIWRQEHGVKGGLREIQEHYRRTLLYGTDHTPDVDFSDGHDLTFAEIVELTADRPGETWIVCPECHPDRYRRADQGGEHEPPERKPPELWRSPPKRSLKVTRRTFEKASYRCIYCDHAGTVELGEEADPKAVKAWQDWHTRETEADRAERTADALTIWRASVSIIGTPAHAYLTQRGITPKQPDTDFNDLLLERGT